MQILYTQVCHSLMILQGCMQYALFPIILQM